MIGCTNGLSHIEQVTSFTVREYFLSVLVLAMEYACTNLHIFM